MMHRAQVETWGQPPRYSAVDSLPAPADGELQLRVLAAGLHNVVRSRASGSHYSAGALPHVLGVDGVAKDEESGQLYYVFKIAPDFGTFADLINVPKPNAIPVPPGIDPVAFAASANPTMSSWMAITQRTADLPKDYTVLIIGATSASGRMAVQVARALGAGKVIGMARNAETLAKVDGLDERIVQAANVKETDLSQLSCDIILDYVYGETAIHVLSSIKPGRPVQYVTIGGLSQADVALPSAILRSRDITLRGAGPGAWGLKGAAVEMPKMAQAMAGWKLLEAQAFPLKDIEQVWTDQTLSKGGRIVIQP